MAEFYLPIKIGQRRMHICHLNYPSVNYGFEFIVPIAGNYIELFSLSNLAKLVSTKGTKFNKFLKNLKFGISSSEIKDYSIDLRITFEEPDGKNNAPLKGTKSSGLGISIDRDSQNNFVANATNLIKINKLNITISYKEKDNAEFEYSFVIHTPKVSDQIKFYNTAIDFGSEASQVAYKNHSGDDQIQFIRLFDKLKEFYDQFNNHSNFWQGKLNDQDPETSRLFKSVFFVNKNPIHGYAYADKPNKHNTHTILQPITPRVPSTDAADNPYKNLFLLPNLKLIELLPEYQFLTDSIHFNSDENNPGELSGEENILSNDLVKDYIRIILCYFLYGILECVKAQTKSEKYFHITLLMPNVYSQEKVYTIVKNFYADFNKIITLGEYSNLKGIEVQAMSESDASFLGMRIRSNASTPIIERIDNESNANYLIIDAGKGTTDFSIVKQQKSHIKYDSILRTGLPFSGHLLSFAFIESISKVLKEIDLIEMIKHETNYSEILNFMELIEDFKKNHTKYTDLQIAILPDNEKKYYETKFEENFSSLEQVNSFLKEGFIEKEIEMDISNTGNNNKKTQKIKGFRIPGSDEIVKQKVKTIVEKIEENIRHSGIERFHQIILAGRAFRFEPLLLEVKNKFDSLVIANNKFIFQTENSKRICIEGAFQSKNLHVNLNSELIGIPVILDDKYHPYSPPKSFLQKLFTSKKEKFIDEFTFYNGFIINHDLKNKTIRIGARDYFIDDMASEASKKYILFYTGDGFILQWNSNIKLLTEFKVSQSFTKMVEETLFPFAYISFGSKEQGGNKGDEAQKPKPDLPKKPIQPTPNKRRDQEVPDEKDPWA